MPTYLGFDIGSNSVGSAWVNTDTGEIVTGTSIFPAGVDESDEKRGDPKNAKRRMTRRTRITLARRARRKRELRLKLIQAKLLPPTAAEFKQLLETTDPWELRRRGLDQPLPPYEFGRVLLHLSQRRGALGLKIADPEEGDDADAAEDGKVKQAISDVRAKMIECGTRTFGELIATERARRVTPITTEDRRPKDKRKGPREHRAAVRNKAGSYEHCADRDMIRREFAELWSKQKGLGGPTAALLTGDLRLALDDETSDSTWRHRGALFGQRRQSWDLGTLGRCVLEPTERCAPHADMYASRYLVVESINNLKIIERGKEGRPLTPEERKKIKDYLSGPLGMETPPKRKGQTTKPAERSKTKVSVSDLRNFMGTADGGWGRGSKSYYRFNIENDEDRLINTDWFSREIIHGAVTLAKWATLPVNVQEGLNRALLKHDPDQDGDAEKLKKGALSWGGLTESEADALVAAWKRRPKPDAKRLNMSRRAVRNLLTVMDRDQPWKDPNRPGQIRWLTQIEARKLIAEDCDFLDVVSGKPLDEHTRQRYATGAKGATARDRHYMKKHLLKKNGEIVYGPDGNPLREPPPAPLISNPVVRKAIHEVRRHLVEYMTTFGRKPDQVSIELMREARMGAKESDRLLFRNRLRNRIRNDIIEFFKLGALSSTQQRAAVDRVVLCMQQGGESARCPLCGEHKGLTPLNAAKGAGCEVAHIVPRACGGHNGLGNIVLAHKKCNQDMGRRTPRQLWEAMLEGGFESGVQWIEQIYSGIDRPKPSEMKNVTGNALWSCYFAGRPGRFGPTFDELKIEQFKKDVTDIKEMTARQEAATKYAARQVMAYLADALYEGHGLPERGGERKIFATDGLWTSRFRREWGLFFDPHEKKAKGLSNDQEHERREKDRGDHRHHAIDALVIALCDGSLQLKWEERERRADKEGINTADQEQMENYRREHQLTPPTPFKKIDRFRKAVYGAVFGEGDLQRPISHRPVKRKLIGALHKATQYGPVVDTWTQNGITHREPVAGRVTVRQPIFGEAPTDFLKPAHLRMPREETDEEAIERLARRLRVGKRGLVETESIRAARKLIKSKSFVRRKVDPKPEKGGIVRDAGLRRLLRRRLEERGLDPNSYTKGDLKRSIDKDGPFRHDSGVPIYSVVLLWSNNDPITIRRDDFDYVTGEQRKLDDPGTFRLYDGQNNHHIEIRVAKDKKGIDVWSGEIVTAFAAAQRKLKKLHALRVEKIPALKEFRKLPRSERAKFRAALREIEQLHPLVDRSDNDKMGGRFVMSLCEGEMLKLKDKNTGAVGFFVVAEIEKAKKRIVLVPHWDARAAGERKDAQGNKVSDSKRDEFTVTATELKELAPPGEPHAVKVRVSPLGRITVLKRD